MILGRILQNKKREVAESKRKIPLSLLKQQALRLPKNKNAFAKALKKGTGISVIAEIKRKSPSKGILRKNFNPVRLALDFEKAGARAISVLTDQKFFGGSAQIFKKVRASVKLPLLRKDFILEEYQIYESRLLQADAVLLIAGLLPRHSLKKLYKTAQSLGLDVLFEAHTTKDIQKILPLKPGMVGINNRDLRTFRVDIKNTERLLRRFGKKVFWVSESGIQNHEDLIYLRRLGVKAVLVGESLMKEKNVRQALRRLIGNPRG